MAIIKNAVTNAGGNPIMLQGLAADLPPAAVAGRLYVGTDTLVLYRDNGLTGWDVIGGGGTTPNLQQVTDMGSNTTNSLIVQDLNSNITSVEPNGIQVSSTNLNNFVLIYSFGIFSNIDDPNLLFATDGTYKKVLGGTYTPNLTPSNNCASVSLISAQYSQIDNVITVNIVMHVTPTTAATNTGVQAISLPYEFAASYNIYQAIGVALDTVTQAVAPVSGFQSSSNATTIVFKPIANNLQDVSITIIYSGTN